MPPRVTVVVPVRNDPLRLRACLQAIQSADMADTVETIVVDDASTDDTADVAAALGARLVRLPVQSGPAAARNAGARVAQADLLFFVDADVRIRPDAIRVVLNAFEDGGVDAVFGSYDLTPGEANFFSQYKNLAHRFYHQQASEQATTFWSGCGAMRKDIFLRLGGFDAARYPRPCIEDIDLGMRLIRDGGTIRIDKRLQATHLKRWTFLGILRSDLFDRAIPWTRLILRQRDLPRDLNLGLGQRLAAICAGLAVLGWAISSWMHPLVLLLPVLLYTALILLDRAGRIAGVAVLVLAVAAVVHTGLWAFAVFLPLAGMLALNAPYYRFFIGQRGPLFALAVVPMQVLYYLYSLAGFAAGVILHLLDHRPSPAPTPSAP